VRGYLQASLFLIFLSSASDLAAAPHPKSRPAPSPPIDFSGVWALDEKMSRNVSSHMRRAVLSVTQEGNRIWISPIQTAEGPRQAILSEEIVVDGRSYEKALGPAGKGLVTADWAKDRRSLWIEVQAGPPENPKEAVQRSVWRLSDDGSVWLRESVSVSKGQTRSALLILRRRKS
jgi:hypothetical protein